MSKHNCMTNLRPIL